jgi:hypothetical protein
LKTLLPLAYPESKWNTDKLLEQKSKGSQRWLKRLLESLFPKTEILEDFNHPKLTYRATSKPMQLDLYLPELSMAFEYQGIQHYEDFYVFGTLSRVYEERDQEKRRACAKANITLIEIPYWWDNKIESLAATINSVRSGLLKLPYPTIERICR